MAFRSLTDSKFFEYEQRHKENHGRVSQQTTLNYVYLKFISPSFSFLLPPPVSGWCFLSALCLVIKLWNKDDGGDGEDDGGGLKPSNTRSEAHWK